MKFVWRVALVILALAAVWWFTVPATRVSVVANSWETPVIEQVWPGHPQSRLILLNKSSMTEYLRGLPVTDVTIERKRPWNAMLVVSLADPDLVVREGKMLAAVFLDQGSAYTVPSIVASWKVMDVTGFPNAVPAFLSTSLEYARLCCELLQRKDKLVVAGLSLSSSTGLSARLKDGKTLVFGDGANGVSKIERGISVLAMPAFKDKKVTIDLRFDGQAVIPGAP